MSKKVRITILVENSVHMRGLKAEHGLTILIEIGGCRVLLDTGQTELLLDNARSLGCSLQDLEAVVLSHGHYDHTGGLAAVCRQSPAARLFLNAAAMGPKFGVNPDGSARDIGMPEESKKALADAGKKLILTPACQEVVEGLFVTGEIPRQTDFEDVGGKFFLDERCQQPDLLVDDQALFVETPEGVVVLLGCAHAGVVNTLLHIEHLTNGKRFHAVIGGMHLLKASPARLNATIAALRRWDVSQLVPMHCTGLAATMRLWAEFPDRCATGNVGTKLGFGQ
jgi:7,8-dihydropterin-6-yl-methyl-4-(beta-D-ribofuranosyl)aminobenzene 5'-phosphate synthase